MELKAYAELVRKLRRKQNLYFRSKSPIVLQDCRILENQVDRETDAILNPVQPTLFEQAKEPNP